MTYTAFANQSTVVFKPDELCAPSKYHWMCPSFNCWYRPGHWNRSTPRVTTSSTNPCEWGDLSRNQDRTSVRAKEQFILWASGRGLFWQCNVNANKFQVHFLVVCSLLKNRSNLCSLNGGESRSSRLHNAWLMPCNVFNSWAQQMNMVFSNRGNANRSRWSDDVCSIPFPTKMGLNNSYVNIFLNEDMESEKG